MKYSIVPAEMTSVKDKIIGNLEMKQVLILSIPIICSLIIYFLIPPFSKNSNTKLIELLFITIVSVILSINISGNLILDILFNFIRYLIRPKIYLFTLRCKSPSKPISKELEYSKDSNPPEIKDRLIDFRDYDGADFYLSKKGELNVKYSK